MQKLGEVFQRFRKARGLKLKDLATAGVSISQLSRFEHGESILRIRVMNQLVGKSGTFLDRISWYSQVRSIWAFSRCTCV